MRHTVAVPLVHTAHLGRTFGDRVAVEDLTLSVNGGEVVALLGPNGAGKTTTFRLLASLIPPTSGDAQIETHAIGEAPARARVGLLTEAPGLWERLSVAQNLLTHARLQGVKDPDAVVARVLRSVDLEDRAGDRAGALSKGLKQRVALARALLHDPPVVLLDEPTAGLDPESARDVRDLIRRLRDERRAVLVSTHNLAEAESIGDRVAILRRRLLAFEPPGELRRRLGTPAVEIDVEGDARAWLDIVRTWPGAAVLDAEGHTLRLRLDDQQIPEAVAALVSAGARIRRVDAREASLEDAYLALVRSDA
ncbi:MAG: ABC transporter ATP-binding protein [Acidobacteria bacterium]|nr:ABC transporter ATP-binding protein [Acidobacteriota bacterium]